MLAPSAFRNRHKNRGRPPEKSNYKYLQWLRGRPCALEGAAQGDCGGKIHACHIAYPFVRMRLETWQADGVTESLSWRPGIRYVWCGPEDTEAVAHGTGLMKLDVVSRHKPGRFPERVFYTRRWVDPEGKEFGKSRCLIATAEKFKRISQGYRIGYRIDPDAPMDGED